MTTRKKGIQNPSRVAVCGDPSESTAGPKRKPRRANARTFQNIIPFPSRNKDMNNARPRAAQHKTRVANAVNNMDAHASTAFTKIESLACLVQFILEMPDRPIHIKEDMVQALLSIRDQAADDRQSVSAEAKLVGCEYLDHAMMRRGRASMKKST